MFEGRTSSIQQCKYCTFRMQFSALPLRVYRTLLLENFRFLKNNDLNPFVNNSDIQQNQEDVKRCEYLAYALEINPPSFVCRGQLSTISTKDACL